MTPKVIITGTPRAGTTYTAKLLDCAGIPTTHEKVFRSWPDETGGSVVPENAKDVEVSWVAHFHLEDIVNGKYGEPPIIIHQVRHPLEVITSWRSMQARKIRRFPWKKSLEGQWYPDLERYDELERACEFYCRVNKYIEEYTDYRIQVEEIYSIFITDIADLCGMVIPDGREKHCSEKVSPTTNTDPNPLYRMTYGTCWNDVTDEVKELAERYGYEN